MRILIDHGCNRNIGDNAMLFNAVNYLLWHTDWHFYVINKEGALLGNYTNSERIKVTKCTKDLLSMFHWRLRDYKIQGIVARQFCALIFWAVLLFRVIKIAVGTKFYTKFKSHLSCSSTIKNWCEILDQMDAYWVVGGGNINDFWCETEAFWKMAFAWIFKLQNKPVIFSGQGIGPIERLSSKLIVKYGIKQISLLSLRENISLLNLHKLGIKHKNCFIVGDDALTISENISYTELSLPNKFIALNIRLSHYSCINNGILDKYAKLVELLINEYTNFKFVFVPIASNLGDSDISSAEQVIDRLVKYPDRLCILKEGVSIENIKSIFKNALMSIGISYHFCLFSLSMGIPTIGLYANEYYKQKLAGLLEMFGMQEPLFDLEKECAETIYLKIRKLLNSFNSSVVLNRKRKMETDWYAFMSLAINRIENTMTRGKILRNSSVLGSISSSLRANDSRAKQSRFGLSKGPIICKRLHL